jgi:UDPglucose 6-dehydrogenase
VGTGYVGLTTGACFAFLGHNVLCQDVDSGKIEILQSGKLPFFEPYLDNLVSEQINCGRLKFSTELLPFMDEADVVFISVSTPSNPINGSVDLSFVRTAAANVGRSIRNNKFRVIVNKSTVPVGSNGLVNHVVSEVLSERSISGHFATASNPEFLRQGNAVFDALFPDRIVVGSTDPQAITLLKELYLPVIEQSFQLESYLPKRPEGFGQVPFLFIDPVSAEVVKYAANAFLAMKISFINEMANICERVGADVQKVASGIGLDSRIGERFLNAGLGWGGSCFGKDLRGLISDAREYGYEPLLLETALDLNYRQRQVCVRKLQDILKVVRGRTVALWGLSFKPDTDDLRDAPSLDIVKKLLEMGASVRVYDPVAMPRFQVAMAGASIDYAKDKYEAVQGANALLLVTEWPEFNDVDWEKVKNAMKQHVIVDGRNYLESKELEGMGFVYQGIGIAC